jgi:outer membrane protein assembly factor BamD (BamD/ComL family)
MAKAILLLLAIFALSSGCAVTREISMFRAYKALEAADYEAALTRLSAAERLAPLSSELQAEVAFLRAKSYEGLQDIPEAIGLYRYLVASFPESPYSWAAKEKLQWLESREAKPRRAAVGW